MPTPPHWFVRSLPGIGMALTASYVGYEIFQLVRKQLVAHQKIRDQEDEDLALALQMSLKETSGDDSADGCKGNTVEGGDEVRMMEDRSQLCSWMGLPADDALDDIPQHQLALCLEVLSYVPVPARLAFVTKVFGRKLTTDQQVYHFLRLLESMDDSYSHHTEEIHIPRQEEEEIGPEESWDLADPCQEKDEEVLQDRHPEEFEDEFHRKDDEGEVKSPASTTSTTATRRSQQPPDPVSSSLACKEQVVVLLTQISEKDAPVFLQALELCPRESRGSFLNRMYIVWKCNYLDIMLIHLERRSFINDTALYQLVEALVRQEEQSKYISDQEVTSTYPHETTDAFVAVLSRLPQESNSTATMTDSSHSRTSDHVSGFLRGLFLCSDSGHEYMNLLFKLESLNVERLKQVTLCFSRFSDTQVAQLIQTLLSSSSSPASVASGAAS